MIEEIKCKYCDNPVFYAYGTDYFCLQCCDAEFELVKDEANNHRNNWINENKDKRDLSKWTYSPWKKTSDLFDEVECCYHKSNCKNPCTVYMKHEYDSGFYCTEHNPESEESENE